MSSDLSIPAIIGGAYVSKEVVLKVLGPTADYLGEGLRQGTEKAFNNIGRVFAFAARKLGPKLDQEGQVPPRVLKGILQDAPFADDELTAEYFGGVLASSKTEVSRDDRSATLVSLLGRLSTYGIRAHYIFYQVIRQLFMGQPLNVGIDTDRARMRTFIPDAMFMAAMSFDPQESTKADTIIGHLLWGLQSESLIGDAFGSARGGEENVRILKQRFPQVQGEGIVFTPSARGVELFVSANGYSDKDILLVVDLEFQSLADVRIPTGSLSIGR